MTIGWFLLDPKLALVQTPHHFYSPDPFERNLRAGTTVPNEGQLFYGLIQDGNDLWNAAFFCGSCAVIRRNAVVLFKGEWQLQTCAKAFPRTRFVELGNAAPKVDP